MPSDDDEKPVEPPVSAPAETLGSAIAAAARRSGLGAVASDGRPSGAALLTAIGGVRGLSEAVIPAVVFIVVYTVLSVGSLRSESVPISLGASVLVALVFTVLRVATRSGATHAVAGLIGVGASAILAILTDKPVNNFALGLAIDAAYGAAFLVSILVRWPLIGVAVGFLLGDGVAWRGDRAKYRGMLLASVCWLALFVLRLAVQLPFYFAGAVTPLAILHLVMGVPLYVPLLIVTWLIVRSTYPQQADPDAA